MADRVQTFDTISGKMELIEYWTKVEDENRIRLVFNGDMNLTRAQAKALGQALVRWASHKEELHHRLLQLASSADDRELIQLENGDFFREVADCLKSVDI